MSPATLALLTEALRRTLAQYVHYKNSDSKWLMSLRGQYIPVVVDAADELVVCQAGQQILDGAMPDLSALSDSHQLAALMLAYQVFVDCVLANDVDPDLENNLRTYMIRGKTSHNFLALRNAAGGKETKNMGPVIEQIKKSTMLWMPVYNAIYTSMVANQK